MITKPENLYPTIWSMKWQWAAWLIQPINLLHVAAQGEKGVVIWIAILACGGLTWSVIHSMRVQYAIYRAAVIERLTGNEARKRRELMEKARAINPVAFSKFIEQLTKEIASGMGIPPELLKDLKKKGKHQK